MPTTADLLATCLYEVEEALKAMKDQRFSPAIRLQQAINLRDDLADILREVTSH